MKGRDDAGFGLVRRRELDAIKQLPHRSKPRAIAVMVAIRAMHGEKNKVAIGDRDFREFGLAREAAAGGLKDCVAIGILEILRKGSCTGRGHKTEYRFVVKHASEQKKAGKPAYHGTETRPFTEEKAWKPANKGRETKPFVEKAAGKPDTILGTSSTSSQKSKEEEVPCPEKRRQLKLKMQRRDRVAKELGMQGWRFANEAGGLDRADFWARKFECGDLSAEQLRSRLAGPPEGFADGMDLDAQRAALVGVA